MILKHYKQVELQEVGEGSNNVKIRWIITQKDGAPNFALRVFEISKNGYTPYHTHDWEHEVFVLKGNGIFVDKDNVEHKLIPGNTLFVPPNELHQFKNNEDDIFEFICVIPIK